MQARSHRDVPVLLSGALFLLAAIALTPPAAAAAENPFANYAGRWVGDGVIKASDGTTETVKCRVTYFTEGNDGLRQNIRCASASYRFEVKSSVVHTHGRLSGTWYEETRKLNGELSGKMSGQNLSLNVTGDHFNASMSVSLKGSSQSVVISPQGIDVTSISMGLRKG
jgi:hypothetical protein